MLTFLLALVAIWLHELAHALAARLTGDRLGARRLSLRPLVNLDPLLSVGLPAITLVVSGVVLGIPVAFGCGRPFLLQRITPAIALAGPLANLALALAGGGVVAAGARGTPAEPLLVAWALVNLGIAAFNLLPWPGSDGWMAVQGIRAAIRNRRIAELWEQRKIETRNAILGASRG
jgi:Zn-dependent protease